MDSRKFIHFQISVDYLIQEVKARKDLEVFKNDATGKWLNKKDTLKELFKMKKKGFNVLPIGECNDYDSTGRCKGHK